MFIGAFIFGVVFTQAVQSLQTDKAADNTTLVCT
jgi:hypothetical protein